MSPRVLSNDWGEHCAKSVSKRVQGHCSAIDVFRNKRRKSLYAKRDSGVSIQGGMLSGRFNQLTELGVHRLDFGVRQSE